MSKSNENRSVIEGINNAHKINLVEIDCFRVRDLTAIAIYVSIFVSQENVLRMKGGS
ncbi:hypothetical protein VCR4J5_670117 [Vibrio crassostreae]|uniref:Uncharacterized protein n=1 Tax=Vibrio crassostreae TaxID=246167 RepID=A0ABP1X2A5_9VIBR|nr:hypothetical protein VCR4J5_670117 [Vibrio crassostreae]